MNDKKIRVLVAAANPKQVDSMLSSTSKMEGVEVVGAECQI